MKYKNLLAYLLLWIVLFVFLQSVYKYHLYHLEQYQLFLFDSSYITSTLASVGGLSLLIYEFLAQFFFYDYVGSFILATLLTLIGLAGYGIIKKIDPQSHSYIILSFLPVITLLFMHYNFNYYMQGTVAYLLMLIAFYFYLSLKKLPWKLACAVILTLLLFWWGGSIALLFAISVLVKEILDKPSQSFWFLIPCIEAALLAYASVRLGMVGEYRFAFLPDMYYHHFLKPLNYSIYFSWIALPLILIVSYLLRKRKPVTGAKHIASVVIQLALAGLIFWAGFKSYGDSLSLRFKEMEYYYRTQQWDKIIDMNEGKIPNYLYSCMLNLALAEKGQLADRMFKFDQSGTQGLIVGWNRSHAVSMLLSDIHYTIGNTGAAQNMAFEANVSSLGKKTGRMLQRLVKTNLIYGEYPVAEKYIGLLEKTYCYSDWATAQRKYLYNDSEIEKNPEYNMRRKSLPSNNTLFSTNITDTDLLNLAVSNPENKNPLEYAGAMYLLAKRLDLFGNMVKAYYGTQVLPSLSVSFQEAIIILNENNPELWSESGVSQAVAERFETYKKFILTNRNSPSLPQLVQNSYGNTYWYYYMFKE